MAPDRAPAPATMERRRGSSVFCPGEVATLHYVPWSGWMSPERIGEPPVGGDPFTPVRELIERITGDAELQMRLDEFVETKEQREIAFRMFALPALEPGWLAAFSVTTVDGEWSLHSYIGCGRVFGDWTRP